jgi:hypothetical protein
LFDDIRVTEIFPAALMNPRRAVCDQAGQAALLPHHLAGRMTPAAGFGLSDF